MTAAEIGHRVVKAAATQAERWGLVRCDVPAPDLAKVASPWIHADARVNPAPEGNVLKRSSTGAGSAPNCTVDGWTVSFPSTTTLLFLISTTSPAAVTICSASI